MWGLSKRYLRRDLPSGVALSRNLLKSALLLVWDELVTTELIKKACSEGFIHNCQGTIRNSGHTSESLGHLKQMEEENLFLPYWDRRENQYVFWNLPNMGILGDHIRHPHPYY